MKQFSLETFLISLACTFLSMAPLQALFRLIH